MSFRHRLVEAVAHVVGLGESLWTVDYLDSPRAEDAGWIPIYGASGAGSGDALIPDFKREAAVRWSRVLAASHLAGRLIEIYDDHVIGDFVQIRARANEKADEELVETLNESIAIWERGVGIGHDELELLHDAYLVDGEVLALLRPIEGGDGPGLDTIDPLYVTGYKLGAMKRLASVHVPKSVLYPEAAVNDPVELPVVRDPSIIDFKQHEHGVVVRTAIKPGIHVRGVGVLFNLVDKLRLDDMFLDADLKRAIASGLTYLDVTVKAGKGQVEDARRQFTRWPEPGSVRVHSDNVEVKPVSPQLGLYEAKQGHNMAHRIIAGSRGIPLTWLGTGEDSNRASAAEMGSPTFRMLQKLQGRYRSFISRLYEVALEMRRQAGLVAVDADRYTLDVQLPELSTRDVASLSQAISQLELVLDTATDRGWLRPETAQRVFLDRLQHLTDVELDPEDEPTPAGKDDPTEAEETAARRVRRVVEAIG